MNYKYIDIHAHVNINAFNDDWEEVILRTKEGGVAQINIGTQQDTSKKAVEIAELYKDGVYAIVGLHPIHTAATYHDEKELGPDQRNFTSRGEEFDSNFYRELAQSEKVVGIGECGFDYFRVDKETKGKQEIAFIKQIELANELEKPLMLHVRASEGSIDAYEDTLAVLKNHTKVVGNVHFFAGTYEIAKQFWDMGFTTSFTGVITFADQYNEVIKNAPLEMLHAETDCPYVAPIPFRGQRCEPLMVREVYKKIAEIRGEDEKNVRIQLIENAQKLYKL